MIAIFMRDRLPPGSRIEAAFIVSRGQDHNVSRRDGLFNVPS
jgi:hypothetical protein